MPKMPTVMLDYKPKYLKVCATCQEEYMAYRNTSVYCSNACKFNGKKQPLLDEEENKILDLYESGMTWKEVASVLNVPKAKMDKYIKIIKSKIDFKSRVGKKFDQTGANNDSWKGGRVKMSDYVAIKSPGHPRGRGGNRGYVMEHILVMEAYIGRYIVFQGRQHPDNEVVHHVNGIRNDNRLENLVLMLSREHSFLHGNQKWARGITDITNGIDYPSLKAACEVANLNENELATYIHFRWKHNGVLWQYSGMEPITGRPLEV